MDSEKLSYYITLAKPPLRGMLTGFIVLFNWLINVVEKRCCHIKNFMKLSSRMK